MQICYEINWLITTEQSLKKITFAGNNNWSWGQIKFRIGPKKMTYLSREIMNY